MSKHIVTDNVMAQRMGQGRDTPYDLREEFDVKCALSITHLAYVMLL